MKGLPAKSKEGGIVAIVVLLFLVNSNGGSEDFLKKVAH